MGSTPIIDFITINDYNYNARNNIVVGLIENSSSKTSVVIYSKSIYAQQTQSVTITNSDYFPGTITGWVSAPLFIGTTLPTFVSSHSPEVNAIYMDNLERFGIGNASPTETLDVTGNIKASGNISLGGDILATGAIAIRSASGTTMTVDSTGNGAVNFGTGAAAKAISIGNSASTTSLDILSGTGNIDIGGTGNLNVAIPLNANNGLTVPTGKTLTVANGGTISIPDSSISGTKLVDATINGSKLVDNTITQGKIADNSIGRGELRTLTGSFSTTMSPFGTEVVTTHEYAFQPTINASINSVQVVGNGNAGGTTRNGSFGLKNTASSSLTVSVTWRYINT
jgi:hypothetical protein